MGVDFVVIPDSKPCSCRECQEMCTRPCWPTPEDAKRIIDAGYGSRLSLDHWVGDLYDDSDRSILILAPALKGYEGKSAPFWPKSEEGCTFWRDGLCELHNAALKPYEGRIAIHGKNLDKEAGFNVHESVAMTWNNPEAQAFAGSHEF